jgi:hypothetical protein
MESVPDRAIKAVSPHRVINAILLLVLKPAGLHLSRHLQELIYLIDALYLRKIKMTGE